MMDSLRLKWRKIQIIPSLGSKEGYLTSEADFSTVGIGQDPDNPVQTFEVEIELDRIFINKEIVLDYIYL